MDIKKNHTKLLLNCVERMNKFESQLGKAIIQGAQKGHSPSILHFKSYMIIFLRPQGIKE